MAKLVVTIHSASRRGDKGERDKKKERERGRKEEGSLESGIVCLGFREGVMCMWRRGDRPSRHIPCARSCVRLLRTSPRTSRGIEAVVLWM